MGCFSIQGFDHRVQGENLIHNSDCDSQFTDIFRNRYLLGFSRQVPGLLETGSGKGFGSNQKKQERKRFSYHRRCYNRLLSPSFTESQKQFSSCEGAVMTGSVRKRTTSKGTKYQAVLETGTDLKTGKRERTFRTFDSKKEAQMYLSVRLFSKATYNRPSKALLCLFPCRT